MGSRRDRSAKFPCAVGRDDVNPHAKAARYERPSIRRYLDRGLSIIPLQPGGKKPFGRWRKWMSRRMTSDDAETWWETFSPTPNVGIVCGQISGGLVVLDIEPEHVAYVRKFVPWMPKNAVVETARGGLHLYCHGDLPCGKLRVGGRIVGDIRGDGGYVVAPPSRIDDDVYSWDKSWGPWSSVQFLSHVPSWVEIRPRFSTGRANTDIPTPVGVRSMELHEAARWLPATLRKCLSGWFPNGAFASPSELDFAIIRELVHLRLDLESIDRFFREYPVGENVMKHELRDPNYLRNSYLRALDYVDQDFGEARPVRCIRVTKGAGTMKGGAEVRAVLDFVDVADGDLYSYSVPVVLGPPCKGQLSGEWIQLAAAFGREVTEDSAIITAQEIRAVVVEGTQRIARVLVGEGSGGS